MNATIKQVAKEYPLIVAYVTGGVTLLVGGLAVYLGMAFAPWLVWTYMTGSGSFYEAPMWVAGVHLVWFILYISILITLMGVYDSRKEDK